MERVVIAAAVIVITSAVALVLGRRRADAPTQDRVAVPRQIDRADFAQPEAPWLVALFTSETCASCADVMAKASVLASPEVAYDVIPWQTRKDVHQRYRIDTVPLIVMADQLGVVRRSFVGTPAFTDLEAALAEAREG